jgi:hypothetical protein
MWCDFGVSGPECLLACGVICYDATCLRPSFEKHLQRGIVPLVGCTLPSFPRWPMTDITKCFVSPVDNRLMQRISTISPTESSKKVYRLQSLMPRYAQHYQLYYWRRWLPGLSTSRSWLRLCVLGTECAMCNPRWAIVASAKIGQGYTSPATTTCHWNTFAVRKLCFHSSYNHAESMI